MTAAISHTQKNIVPFVMFSLIIELTLCGEGVFWVFLLFVFASEEQRDKFELLYQSYKRLMLYKAYQILGDHMLAEDAVSEAFIRIYKNVDKIEDPSSGSAAAFAATVVKNVALSMLQREKSRGSRAYELLENDREEAAGPSLENQVLGDISRGEILQLVDSLKDELRSVFLLKYAHDLSHKEIGKLLGITENNVTVRLHRAKKKIAALLQKEGYVREEAR